MFLIIDICLRSFNINSAQKNIFVFLRSVRNRHNSYEKKKTRRPGSSSLGLGCWGMSRAYGKGDRKESISTIQESIDMGVNFLDTADVYGSGHNEELLAEAISGIRNHVILATKFAYIENNDGSMSVRCDPEYIKIACDRSLQRLNTDYIDLYYMHRLDSVLSQLKILLEQ